MLVNTCEIQVDYLLEIRVAVGYRSVADVDHMIAMIRRCMDARTNEKKFVIAADWRAVSIMSPETAARVREMLTISNPRVIRSAILTSPEQSTTHLQVVRLLREAENASRRMFTSPGQLCAWLAEVLTSAAATRVRAFLGVEA